MLKGPILLGTIRTSFVFGLRLLIQAGTLLLVARMLGPDDFGVFAGIASLAVLLGALSTFGTHLVLFGEVAKGTPHRDSVLSYALPTTLLCGSCLLVLFLIATHWLLGENLLSMRAWIIIGITETVLQPLYLLMVAEHHALGRIARSQLMQNIPLLLRLLTASIIFFSELKPALDMYTLGYIISSVLALLIGLYFLPQKWPTPCTWKIPNSEQRRIAFGYAATNISKSAPAEFDKTLAVKLLPMEAAGLFAAGARVVGAITLPVIAMTQSALPRLFREGGNNTPASYVLVRGMYGFALLYGTILGSALWMFAPILGQLFGSKYQGVHETIRWLCLGIPGVALRMVAGNILLGEGKPWMRVGLEIKGLLVLTFSSVVLVSCMGKIGMPLAVVCAEWTMAITGTYFVYSVKYNKTIQT